MVQRDKGGSFLVLDEERINKDEGAQFLDDYILVTEGKSLKACLGVNLNRNF